MMECENKGGKYHVKDRCDGKMKSERIDELVDQFKNLDLTNITEMSKLVRALQWELNHRV